MVSQVHSHRLVHGFEGLCLFILFFQVGGFPQRSMRRGKDPHKVADDGQENGDGGGFWIVNNHVHAKTDCHEAEPHLTGKLFIKHAL